MAPVVHPHSITPYAALAISLATWYWVESTSSLVRGMPGTFPVPSPAKTITDMAAVPSVFQINPPTERVPALTIPPPPGTPLYRDGPRRVIRRPTTRQSTP